MDSLIARRESDFPSVSYPWLLAAQGSPTHIATVDDRRGEDLTACLIDAIDDSTTAACFSAIQYGTGTKVDVRAVADRAHEAGARANVDATQIAGAAPVDMASWNADAVVCSGYKWPGLNVIVDDVVIDDEVLGDWLDVLDELEPTWVAVRCLHEIMAERELRRGDRPIGMTGTQTNSVHRSLRYAFEIDTGELTPSEALDELRGRLAP